MSTSTSTDRETEPAGPDPVSDRAADRFYLWLLVGLVAGVLALGAVALVVSLTSDDSPDPLGEVDVGFLQDTLDHHEQALAISAVYLEADPDGAAAPHARQLARYQTRDVGRMEEWLADDGSGRGEPERLTMTWLPAADPAPVSEMYGMPPRSRIDELAAAEGAEADALFFELMTAHHLGGVTMADYAAEHAESEFVRRFARGVSRSYWHNLLEFEEAVAGLDG